MFTEVLAHCLGIVFLFPKIDLNGNYVLKFQSQVQLVY